MIEVVAAVVINEKNQVLLASRPSDKPPCGWEFPGGKVEPGETIFEALKRELREELAWETTPEKELYSLSDGKILLHFIQTSADIDSIPKPCENQEIKWVDLSSDIPDGLLKNDHIFWKFLTSGK